MKFLKDGSYISSIYSNNKTHEPLTGGITMILKEWANF